MPRRYNCPICGQNNFASLKAVDEHVMKHHVGRLSRSSFEYLLSLGVPVEKIVRFCGENGVKLTFDAGETLRGGCGGQLTLEAFGVKTCRR